MIRLIILLFTLSYSSTTITAQIFMHQPSVYYEYLFMEDGEGCHYYNMEMDSSLIHPNEDFEDYINLKIIKNNENLYYFDQDENGNYYCPYDRDDKTEKSYSRSKSMSKEQRYSLGVYYDTICILRNRPSDAYNPIRRRGGSLAANSEEIPFDPIELITSSADNQKKSLIDVQVEFREGDIISKNGKTKILCPYNITSEVIIELNKRLIKVGYLSDKKRGIYQEEIRDALYEFQEDNNIEVGFIDQETISALKLDIIID